MHYHEILLSNQIKPYALTAAALLAVTPNANAGVTSAIENALKFGQEDAKYGQITFDTRYRYEYVDQENIDETADVATVRVRLGYLTPKFHGVQGFAEYEGNFDTWPNDFNSTKNANTQFPVVADPQDNELNQLWISFDGIPDTLAKVGRQRLTFDNWRFIGNVVWRQMEQTFDSALITNNSLPDTQIDVAYLMAAQDIFSKHVGLNAPLVHATYSGFDWLSITGYAYFLDYDNAADSRNFANSSQTFGVRFTGAKPVNDKVKAMYTAEYAFQSDYENNPNNYQASYWHAQGAFEFAETLTFKGGVEQLDGTESGSAFSTPLATLHAFQGWADKFLVTPGDGIRDVYGEIGLKLFGIKMGAIYHEFTDDTGTINYGNEFDFIAVKKFNEHYKLLFKYAHYNADTFSVDTDKLWVEADISF